MKYFKFALSVAFVVMITSTFASAGSGSLCEESIKKGKAVFNSPEKLGSSTGISCAKCHPDGKGLKGVAKKKKYEDDAALAAMMNTCIVQATKGKKLAVDSEDMKYLMYYVRSIGHEGEGSGHKGSDYKKHEGHEPKGSEPKGSGNY